MSLVSALMRNPQGYCVIYAPDLGSREHIVQTIKSVTASNTVVELVRTPDVVFDHPNALTIVLPDDEATMIGSIAGRRDHILQYPRSQPIVIVLLRGGDGAAALSNAPGLASLVRASDPDLDQIAEVDLIAATQLFEQQHGLTPRQVVLAKGKTDSQANLQRYYTALLLGGANGG